MNKAKIKKLCITIFLTISILVLLFSLIDIFEPASITYNKDEKKVKLIINTIYHGYEIESMYLHRVDIMRNAISAGNYHKATDARVVIKSENEKRTISLKKFSFLWIIEGDDIDYGLSVPDNEYYIKKGSKNVGKAVDIENMIKKDGYWIIPSEEGEYSKSGTGEDWYYRFEFYSDIYTTKGGRVYALDMDNNEWEISDVSYSDLCQQPFFKKADKEFVQKIIKKYTNKEMKEIQQ